MDASKEKDSVKFLANAPNALKWRFQISLLNMIVTTSFLTQLEQTKMQGTSKWWYDRGVTRIQFRIKMIKKYYFCCDDEIIYYDGKQIARIGNKFYNDNLFSNRMWTSI